MSKSKKKLKPSKGRVLVKRVELANTTPGGIVLPDGVNKEKIQYAVVQDVGYDVTINDAEPGNTILIYKHVGTDVEFGGETLTILTVNDILATVF